MTQRATAIHIAQPCAESWAAMTPAGLGRHCAACQRTVVDFMHQTDAEILAALRQAAGSTCARLRADQLGRALIAPGPAPRWRAWLGAALAIGGVLGAARATAQTSLGQYNGGPVPAASTASGSPAVAPPSPAQPAAPAPNLAAPGELLTIRGIVTDSASQEGLPGATVLVAGTTTGTSTDATGAFTLSVAAGTTSVPLIVSSVGYISHHATVPATSRQPVAVRLQADVMGLMSGEVVIIGGVSQRPWPWHPRRLFNWSKYWLMRPFQP